MTTSKVHPEALAAVEGFLGLLGEADGVSAVVIYGSAVRDDFDPTRSGVDVLLALDDTRFSGLDTLSPILVNAWRRWRIEPYLVGVSELQRLADVFPVRVLDMQRAHVTVMGDDPLASIDVESEHLRLRVEQELRNRLLRTRRRVVFAAGDPLSIVQLVVTVARALRSTSGRC